MASQCLLAYCLSSFFSSGQRAWKFLGYRNPQTTFAPQNSSWNNSKKNNSKKDTVLV